jgi:hypothetical protein
MLHFFAIEACSTATICPFIWDSSSRRLLVTADEEDCRPEDDNRGRGGAGLHLRMVGNAVAIFVEAGIARCLFGFWRSRRPHPTAHKAPPTRRANPTTKITVSVRVRIQPLRMVRTHHGLAGAAASIQ